ncbi:RING-H2 finger protein ATL66-like [Primulina tabacum]|uniref:RING-H2 finger protein ATL66-like n=1 Tax=Primulina tabacum TaxID=48773 RepID=UPI003F599948
MKTSSSQKRFRQPMIRSHYQVAECDVDSNLQINGTVLFFIGVTLLCITILFTVLFLCSRWASRRRLPPSNSSTHAAAPKPALGLDPVAVDDIPVVMYGAAAEASAGAECCICLGLFGDADEVKILPQCRHCFHSGCLDEWLKKQPSCPLCRCMLRVDFLV